MAGGSIATPLFKELSEATKPANRAAQAFVLGLPPQRDVGYVTDHAYVPLYLWNGTTIDAVLTSVSGDEGSEGIFWDATPPDAVLALQSLRVILDVSIDGPLVIDAYITFTSSCNSIVLHLTGTRAPHLSGDVGYMFFRHNWEDGLDESLSWKTDVLIAHDRTEQRVKLRTHPRRSWDLRLLLSGAARRKLETWIGQRKTRYLFSPVWRDESRLDSPITAGESVITFDNPQLLDYSIGRWVAVYDAWDNFEIRTVTGIGANFIAVDAPFEYDWPAGSMISPCRYGVTLDQRRVSRFNEVVGDYQIKFEAKNESLMPAIASPETYRSILVCPFVPSWVNDGEETWDNKWVRLDNDTGVIEYDLQSIEPVMTRSAQFMITGRDRIDLFFRFLFYCSGRLAPFWIPATDRGFELAVPATSGDSTIVIEPIYYEYALNGSPARSHIEMTTTDGAVIRRMITGVQTLPEGTEQLTLDSPLPVSISTASLNRCCWFELCRLDSDSIDLKWFTGDCIETTLPIMVLP